MTPLDKLTEAAARTFAINVESIVTRRSGPVDVCRFHREIAAEMLEDIQAALPEGHYLGREGVVRAQPTTFKCERTDDGAFVMWHATGPERHLNTVPLFVIEPVEDQP